MIAAKLRSTTAEGADWLGHRVWMIDGSGFSMPGIPELQNHFGSPRGQRPGCGFPVGHLVALFDLTTGMLLRMTTRPMRTHDMSQATHLEDMKRGRSKLVHLRPWKLAAPYFMSLPQSAPRSFRVRFAPVAKRPAGKSLLFP